MTLPAHLRGLRVALVGLGRAHRALAPKLRAEGAQLAAFDRSATALREAQALQLEGVFGADYLGALLRYRPEVAFLTPGMPKHLPEFEELARRGAVLSGEAAYFLARRRLRCLGITGSAGKTTTTSLVGEMLAAADLRVSLCGNIGPPFASALDESPAADLHVAEFSSFQLSLCDSSPEIAAILNIRPNHLDVHRDLADYRESKWRIGVFQGPEDILVVAEELRAEARARVRSRVLSFGVEGGTDARVAGDWIEALGERLVPVSDLGLRGRHNVENALAASLLALVAGAPADAVRSGLRRFCGVAHRQEVVGESGGVLFVDDSIATTPDRVLAAFASFPGPIVWLAGGYDKHLDYAPLLAGLQGVRRAFLFGPVGGILRGLLQGGPVAAELHSGFDAAVRAAAAAARPGDTVLLSPAAASYDEFADFAERGERFRAIVRELTGAGA